MNYDVVAIVVNHNSGELLKNAVDSLLDSEAQPAIEVVDNASADRSIETIRCGKKYREKVNITRNEQNMGFAGANNQILKSRNAQYYLLMNPDCVLDKNAIGEFVLHLDNDPDIGLAGGLLKNPDGSVQKTSKRRFPTPWSGLARTFGLHRLNLGSGMLSDFDLANEAGSSGDVEVLEAVSGAMMFVRGSALARVGLLDEEYFMHCEDLDWCKRFWNAGYKVAYIPGATAVHLKGGSGRGPKVVWHLHRGMIRFYRKHYRRRYSLPFTGLVYAAVYVRCAVLMALSLLNKRRP
ncbi:MAG: N-acetylglucosaminyl-diphospho-decaprenol L-rhamnosyltransferase [Gammaproteobacteria bacterium]|nr:N-acetylglucosaminyl-diphospho-decaprenol L-rhamnosyltransferase [Gammaproteobacteria bacterium]